MLPHSARLADLALLSVALAVTVAWRPAGAQDVRINEIMASNVETLADEDGDYPDWIELYNAGDSPVDLSDFGLSDDPADPFKWTMPAATIESGGHVLVFASGKDRDNVAGHWETLVDAGDVWQYRVNSQPPAEWKSPGFDAGAWSRGPTGIGYGDGDDVTEMPRGSLVVFARTSFTIDNAAEIQRAVLHVDYDDGFVASLNGVEIARANVSGSSPGTGRAADTDREALHYQGGSLEAYEISDAASLLHPGENVLAVQVHNVSVNSSDMTLIPVLSVGLAEPPSDPRGLSSLTGSLRNERPHAGFKLSRDGEPVILTAPDGTTVDEITLPALPSDVSFGRAPDGAESWVFFDAPTPAMPNASDGFSSRLPAPTFSHPPGKYDASSINVALDAGDGAAEIRYTLDGTEPTESSLLYAAPLTFTETEVLRARAFSPGALPGPVATGTYLIGERTSLPIVTITTDPDNLWDYQSGIYVMGPNAESAVPHFGANFWQDWEKPAHLELIEPDAAAAALSVGAGIKVFGGWSRAHAQKSLSVFARGQYGADAFDYVLLPDKPIDSYQSFVLRNGGNDWSYTLFRDAMMQYLIKDAGVDMQGYRPAVVYINGEYWGMQNIREKISEHYAAQNHPGVDPDQIDMLEIVGPPGDYNVIHGSDAHFRGLIDFVSTRPMASESDFTTVEGLMDVDEFIDYQIAQIYYGNRDWPGNNVKLWRPRVPGGRWRWILFDTDFGFGLYGAPFTHQTLAFAAADDGPEWPNPPHSTLLFRRLLENPTFRRAFINRFADHLNTSFQPERVKALIDEMAGAIADEVPRHSARWNGSLGSWSSHVDQMRRYADGRPAAMWSQLRSFFGLRLPVELTIDMSSAGGGMVQINRVTPDDFPWTGSYFRGMPVRVEALPAPGYRFAGWSGGAEGGNPVITIDPASGLTIEAHFERGGGDAGHAVVSEILYNAPDDIETGDWIELYNPGNATIDLSGWRFVDDDDEHAFTLPDGTQLAAASFLVICRDPIAFEGIHSSRSCVGPWGDFGLGSGSDMVRIFDGNGAVVDSVAYDDEDPWPMEPDGDGATLELKDPDLDNSLPGSWAASVVRGGTPGAVNSVSVASEPAAPDVGHAFALHPNHPNPFGHQTTIFYELDQPGRAVVRLYDVLGREVRTLVDAHQTDGQHRVTLDANDLASGVYVCRLEAAGRARSRTILVLR